MNELFLTPILNTVLPIQGWCKPLNKKLGIPLITSDNLHRKQNMLKPLATLEDPTKMIPQTFPRIPSHAVGIRRRLPQVQVAICRVITIGFVVPGAAEPPRRSIFRDP